MGVEEAARATPAATPSEALSVTTEDEWVRPSQVAPDRVIHTSTARRRTELEKAREAFRRADTVGISEDATGVVEARMLRPSEVKELFESAAEIMTEESTEGPPVMEGSEPVPPEAAELLEPTMPTPEDIEERILGRHSLLVTGEEAGPPVQEPPVETGVGEEFSSARYTETTASAEPTAEVAPGEDETVPPESAGPTAGTSIPGPSAEITGPEPAAVTEGPAAPSGAVSTEDTVMVCPACGSVIDRDGFEYPRQVYNAMAAARLKQARFLVVQGKAAEASEMLEIARALFTKAGDEDGVRETTQLIDSLTRLS